MNEPKKYEEPFVAVMCQILGWLALGGGFLILCAALYDAAFRPVGGGASGMVGFAIAATASSVFWFALARIVIAVTEMAWNSRRGE